MCRIYEPNDTETRIECQQDGTLLSCQLCPHSPTYWRNTATPPATNPWNGTGGNPVPDLTGWIDNRDDPTEPCILCNIHTPWISPRGIRCHPACADTWSRQHRKAPDAPATT
jgi:hypothetical protein